MELCRSIRWAGHVAHMGEKTNTYRILMEDLDIGRRIISKWISKIYNGRM
jgi:hypothetical protein